MPFVEDLAPFFAVDEFASDATLDGVAVRGIFDNEFILADVGETGIASTQPVMTMATSDVPTEAVGASLVVNATAYLVSAVESDGTGVTRLFLQLAP